MTLSPGFAAPGADAQSCFRAVLDALSRPGSLHSAGTGLIPPAPLDPATAAVLLALVDADTTLAAGPDFAPGADWIAFHCGLRPIADPQPGGFVLARALPDLAALPVGQHAAPEASVTLVLQVGALGTGRAWDLSGPGIRTTTRLSVDGLPPDFVARWAANHALFPRGIDLLLCAGTCLAALPRSVAVAG